LHLDLNFLVWKPAFGLFSIKGNFGLRGTVSGMSTKKTKKRHKTHGNKETRDLLALSGNPVWRAFAHAPVSEQTQTSIGLSGRKALYALTQGQGEFLHCRELIVTAHAAIHLAEEGYGGDLMDDFNAALAVALDCRSRGSIGDGYWLEEEEVSKLVVLLDLHEQQLALAEKADLAAAIIESYKRAG
jgi:hypothetical protein